MIKCALTHRKTSRKPATVNRNFATLIRTFLYVREIFFNCLKLCKIQQNQAIVLPASIEVSHFDNGL